MPSWPLRAASSPAPPPLACHRRLSSNSPASSSVPRCRTAAAVVCADLKPPHDDRQPITAQTPKQRRARGDGVVQIIGVEDDGHRGIGLAAETKDEHMRRHGPGGDRSCSRCRWYTMEHRWATTYGRFSGPAVPQPRSWIGERPARWGGTWGLGCTLCSQSLTRRVDPRGTAGQDHRRLCTKWSRFEVRSTTLQAEHFAEHRTSDIHKVALYAWMFPDEPVQLKLQASVSDNRLLSGCVPQLEDWVRAWRAARTPRVGRRLRKRSRQNISYVPCGAGRRAPGRWNT